MMMVDDYRISHGGGGGGGGGGSSASSVFGIDSNDSVSADRITLTAKPHAFAGSVLSPKHARELTPSLCLAIASALAEQLSPRKSSVPYTLWITEAWRVLGWAEPSAALFWEMATMYHTLYLAARAFAAEYQDGSSNIPPILSCGSTSSMGSGMTADRSATNIMTDRKKFSTAASAKELPVWLVGTYLLLHCEEFAYQRNISGQDERRFFGGDATVTATGAGVGLGEAGAGKNNRMDFSSLFRHSSLSPRTRLHAGLGGNHDTTHCTAYLLRHLRKVLLLTAISHTPEAVRACMHLAAIPSPTPQHHHNTMQQQQQSLDHRMRISSNLLQQQQQHQYHHHNRSTGSSTSRGGQGGGGISHHLTANSPSSSGNTNSNLNNTNNKYSADELRRQHDEEHGNVGLSVHLSMEDLERLHLILQLPLGGGIEDPPLKIGEFLFRSLYQTVPPPTASLPIGDVEREIRRHLELELLMSGVDPDDKEEISTDEDEQVVTATSALVKLSLNEQQQQRKQGGISVGDHSSYDAERAKQPPLHNQYLKELSYSHLRGTTILLKPNPTETSSGASSAASQGEPQRGAAGGERGERGGDTPYNFVSASAGRLHDLAISDCSDAHFYLLQPFEHATISACTGCTIVVGAVAGLLHVVDCEKTSITSAARRILVSNSSDVQLFIFTPSPPLLVGDNRSCQFAPYNTYYDGLREDLLATGLAAAVVSENHSPYHGGGGGGRSDSGVANDAAWPPLQCASNKWKQPVELSKLEVPQVQASGPSSPAALNAGVVVAGGAGSTASSSTCSNLGVGGGGVGADDKAMGKAGTGNDATMLSSILMPASEFHILFVPLESDAARQRRLELEQENEENNSSGPMESQYCLLLAEILQLSPFRLPVEFERRVLMKAERMRNIQQAVKKNLSDEQQHRFEDELNRGFREWLVQSGNLRQVLDLVHLERRGGT